MPGRIVQRNLVRGVLACYVLLTLSGCPEGQYPSPPLNLSQEIVGTWELHQGGTITFSEDGTFYTSESTEGTYEVVRTSVVLDIENIEGDLNQVLTYLGRRPSGQLVFAQETPLGFTRIS
jgi:hypothetical protein